jgi:N-dimethylarginine dimethylaminohydrolase
LKVREVLVHKPGLELKIIDKPFKWLFTDYPNPAAMEREHNELVKTLQNEGVRVHYLRKVMERKPKLYVIRDSAIVLDRKAVTCHFIHSVRRGEEQIVKKRLKELGIKIAGHIFVPGFLQGSDLFFTDKNHAFAIVGKRTNVEGVKHLMEILKIDITPIKMEGLASTQFNILNDVAVMSEEVVYQPVYKILKDNGFDIVLASREQTEGMGVNFLQIDDNKIVNTRSDINKKLRMIGFDIIEVEIRELAKGNCGIRNMCLPFY